MRSGKLDRLIDIQRVTTTLSDSGEPVETWSDIATRRHASITPIRGDETFDDPQMVSAGQIEFRFRYSAELATLNPKDRIVYPASDPASPLLIIERNIFDVVAVHRLGRREGFRVIASRRPDLPATAEADDWILATGFWRDVGFWRDNKFWID